MPRIIAQYERLSQPQKAEYIIGGQAARLREMAVAESVSDLRDKLFELASQYDRLSERALR